MVFIVYMMKICFQFLIGLPLKFVQNHKNMNCVNFCNTWSTLRCASRGLMFKKWWFLDFCNFSLKFLKPPKKCKNKIFLKLNILLYYLFISHSVHSIKKINITT